MQKQTSHTQPTDGGVDRNTSSFGEGNRDADRRYREQTQAFVAAGKVEAAAEQAQRELDARKPAPPLSKRSTTADRGWRVVDEDDEAARIKLYKLLASFDNGMLVTFGGDGELRARPMRIAARQQQAGGDLWFAASLDSAKVTELERDDRVAVTLTGGRTFVSISGRARLVRSREQVERMWSESWRLWFPDGPNSEDLVLIQLQPTHAEYWDASGLQGLRFVFEAARAWLSERPIETESFEQPGYHAVLEAR